MYWENSRNHIPPAKAHLRRDDAPAGRRYRAVRAADVNVIVQIPYRGLPRARIVKQVIRFAVAVKIGCPDQFITLVIVGPDAEAM